MSHPKHIVLEKNTYLFPANDDEIYTSKGPYETYTLDFQINIPIINSSGKGKWIGFAFNIGRNIFVLRDWFRRRTAGDGTGILLFDIGNPVGEELCLYVIDNSLSGRPLKETLEAAEAKKNVEIASQENEIGVDKSGPVIEHMD